MEALRGARVDCVRLHDLRHLTASVLIDAGESVVEVPERLGHSPSTMRAVYSHLIDQAGQRHADLAAGSSARHASAEPDHGPTVSSRQFRSRSLSHIRT